VGSNWYQPLRNTLSILSKLYNVLEIEVCVENVIAWTYFSVICVGF
jgi:hypothetical protein